MAETCPHGFSPPECLICRTLGTQPKVQVETSGRIPFPPSGVPLRGTPVKPDAVYPSATRRRLPGSTGTHIALVVVGLLAIGLVAWIVAGVVFALLHVVELILVAAVAGWAGYRLGHYRGRHQHP